MAATTGWLLYIHVSIISLADGDSLYITWVRTATMTTRSGGMIDTPPAITQAAYSCSEVLLLKSGV